MRLRLCYENLNDCALQEPNVVDALAHQLFSRRIFIKCFHKDKILETWHENWAETGFQGITNAFPSQALLTWEQKNHERGNDTFITRKKPNFHIPFPTTFRKLSLTLKGLPESRPCGYYQVTSTNMELCHAKCLFTNFIRSETPKHFWKNESFKSLCRKGKRHFSKSGMGQEFREASLWINSFLSCLLTHNFIISLSLSSSSSTDLSFLPRKAHSRYYCLLVRGWFLSFFLFLFKLVGRSEASLLHKASLLFDGRHQREKNRYKPSSATDIYFFCLISRTKNGHN